ncbi:MAG: hypothetical protein NTY66_00370 [Candidatus Vogelbacteria bacterium]|nr:hypothetical protein [Candidatus Vogelbacteria bacterium]
MSEQEMAELAKQKGFEPCRCRDGQTFRERKISNFLCAAYVSGGCTRQGSSQNCHYADRGWTPYRPLPKMLVVALSKSADATT